MTDRPIMWMASSAHEDTRCGTCKHWERTPRSKRRRDWGVCRCKPIPEYITDSSRCTVLDGTDGNELACAIDFACIQWESA